MKINVAWWFRFVYLPAVVISMHIVAFVTGETPELTDRFDYWVKKAITVKRVD